jgi:hypothetical protein
MLTGEENQDAERQTQLETMLAEFRAAQHRRLVKEGVALWTQTEAAYRRDQLNRAGPQ